jgi:hypothetical protein
VAWAVWAPSATRENRIFRVLFKSVSSTRSTRLFGGIALKKDRNPRSPRPARLARLTARLIAPFGRSCGACVAVLRRPGLALRFRRGTAPRLPFPGSEGRPYGRPLLPAECLFINGARWPTAVSAPRTAVGRSRARDDRLSASEGGSRLGRLVAAVSWRNERARPARRERSERLGMAERGAKRPVRPTGAEGESLSGHYPTVGRISRLATASGPRAFGLFAVRGSPCTIYKETRDTESEKRSASRHFHRRPVRACAAAPSGP